ncbi:MAG: response regulator [Deltaproteobacteria bacterium]|nr:response regulator [Deltaproteobacteria bacterium]
MRNSIAIPIVSLILVIGSGVLTAGYYINKSVFHTVFEERESNKARNIHLTIESIVSTEVTRISSLARILKNDTDVAYGLFHYNGTRGDAKPLKSAMDQLYPKINLPVFIMSDPGGNVLYSAGTGKGPNQGRLKGTPAFKKALKGEQVITAIPAPEGFGIRAIVPIHGFGSGKPSGLLILGNRIDDVFAGKIARETGSQVFIATSDKVIAGSYDPGVSGTFDPRLAKDSLDQGKPIFHMDNKAYRSFTYVPITIVDEKFCLLIETDISVIRELLAMNRTRMAQWGLILLIGIAMIGAVFALLLILPLNRLYGKALQTIREYSGEDPEAIPRENEISTLVRANDVMLDTIKNHLAERARAEEAFHETSSTLHALIEASPLAVVVGDASGTVRVWNPAAIRMFGWDESETIGRPNPLLSSDGNPELRATCNLVLSGEKFSNTEIRCRARDGSEIVLAFSGAPLLDAQAQVSSMVAIMADVTDAREAEAALHRSEEQLRQSMKMEAVGKLAGGVAHDFNNLLSVITGYSELLLLRTDDRNPARREIEEIHKAGERAASLTQQLLAFSRRQVLKPKRIRMNDVVENLGKMLRRLIGEDIEFATEDGGELWAVRADPSQIEQILMNLCVNARDAMPEGGRLVVSTANVTLDAPLMERELTVPPGRYAALRVADNGTGMDEEILSRIFEPFFTTKSQGKGTGLGLATVYGIVKQSGGYIRVVSAPGQGTSFSVYLPAVEGEEEETAGDPPEPACEEAAGHRTILLVEDEEMVRELAVEIFRGNGYTVLDAPNGASALEISDRHDGRIDLLVTDLVMPGMNGIELSRKVTASRPGTPVLYMSGYAEDARAQLDWMDGGNAFLQKPITPMTLSRKAREILSARASGVTAGSAGAHAAPSRPPG